MFVESILGLTCGNAWVRGCGFWLREPGRDRRAEQFERARLDRGRGGEFLDFLPAEIDDLPAESGQVAEQIAVTVQRYFVGGLLCGVFFLAWSERWAGMTGSAGTGMFSSVKVSGANALRRCQVRYAAGLFQDSYMTPFGYAR